MSQRLLLDTLVCLQEMKNIALLALEVPQVQEMGTIQVFVATELALSEPTLPNTYELTAISEQSLVILLAWYLAKWDEPIV